MQFVQILFWMGPSDIYSSSITEILHIYGNARVEVPTVPSANRAVPFRCVETNAR